MSWTRQVWHLFLKDVQEQRWLLAMYGTVLLLGVLQGIGYFPYQWGSESTVSIPMSLALRALAFMIGAAVILGDSPHDARAYWATLPYARSAVAAAKLLMLATLLFATVAALVPPLLHLDTSGMQLWMLLVDFGVGYGAMLAAVALFSSMVRRLRSVLLLPLFALATLVVVNLVGGFTGGAAGPPVAKSGSVIATLCLWLLFAVVALAGAAYVYRTRRVTTARRTAALAFSLVLLLSHLGRANGGRTAPEIDPARVSGITPRLRYVNPAAAGERGSQPSRPRLELASDIEILVDGIPPEDRVVLVAATTGVVTDSGTDHELDWFTVRTLVDPPLPLPEGVSWVDPTPDLSHMLRPQAGASGFNGGNWDNRPELASVASVHAEGQLEFRRAEEVARVGVSRDTSITSAGWQFTITSARRDVSPVVQLEALYVRRARDGRLRSDNAFSELVFVLVNRARGQAVRVTPDNFRSSASAWLLAPGTVAVGDTQLSGNTRFYDQDDADMRAWQDLLTPQWLADAELVVYDWRLTGISPITLTTEIR